MRPKPVPSDDVLTSREAGEKHDNAIEADGDASRLQLGRLCRYFRDQGMPLPFECPKPPEPANMSWVGPVMVTGLVHRTEVIVTSSSSD